MNAVHCDTDKFSGAQEIEDAWNAEYFQKSYSLLDVA
jgi:hypothetical protein